jgi:chitinase
MRTQQAVNSVLYLLAFTAMLSASPASSKQPTFHVVGYLPDYRLADFTADQARIVTDLIYFSAEPTPQGDLKTDHLKSDALKKLQAIKAKHHLTLSLCVGGWGRSAAFAQLAASENPRQWFVASLVSFCRENQFDGIDLDWEHPANDAQRQDYGKFITELKKGCQPHGLLVTVAIADWQVLPADAVEVLDRVHLMAYDAPGRHSTYDYAVSSVERRTKGDVPAGKVCLGVPFYGRAIDGGRESLTYDEIVRKYGPPPASDEVDGIYFNGVETIRRKTHFAVENKLGGIMIWELGQDTMGEQSLLRVIGQAVRNRQ